MKFRKLTAIFVVGALTLSLAACGGNGDPVPRDTDTAVEDADEPDRMTESAPAAAEQPAAETEEVADTAEPVNSEAPQLEARTTERSETAEDGTLLLEAKLEVPVLTEASAGAYPALDKALTKEAEDWEKSFTEETDEYLTWATEEFTENGAERFEDMNYSNYGSYWVARADQSIVSFFHSYDNYTGGAHGMYGATGETFDAKTGEKLMLSDVLTDLSKVQERVKEAILKEYGDEAEELFYDLDASLAVYDVSLTEITVDPAQEYGYSYPYDWGLNEEGIEFYFGPYELTAYAGGAQDVTIKYADYPDWFREGIAP